MGHPTSYLAVLTTCGSDGKSVFSIVETNPFKHLTHLSLHFVPGDDAAIKSYLAARFAQITNELQHVTAALQHTTAALQQSRASEAELQKQLDTLTQQTESTRAREKLQYADDLNTQVNLQTYNPTTTHSSCLSSL